VNNYVHIENLTQSELPLRAVQNLKKTLVKNIETKIVGTLIWLLIMGIVLIYLGYLISGIVIGAIALIAAGAGWRDFDTEKNIVGAVTVWDRFKKSGHEDEDANTLETVAVEGKTILAPYFPFFISAIEINVTKDDWTFEETVFSVEGIDDAGKPKSVPVTVEIILTVKPDKRHLNSYIQSGGTLNKIKELMKGIPYREVQRLVKTAMVGDNTIPGLSYMEVVQQGDLLSNELGKSLNGHSEIVNGTPTRYKGIFEEKSFGIVCEKVQLKFKLDPRIQTSMVGAASIIYETDARATEYRGDIAAAKLFQKQLGIKSGKEAWETFVDSRLMRDKGIQRIQIEGKGKHVGGLILGNAKVNMGDTTKTNSQN
jgi:hypothetical protein